MNEQINEQISAWMDDELAPAEEALLLKRLQQDAGLARRLQHYYLIGDALRGQLPERIAPDLSERVAARIAAENPPAAMPVRAHWGRPLLGAAIAASVAVVAVLAVRQTDLPDNALQLAEQTPPAAEAYRRIPPAQLAGNQPQLAEQLNPYLVNHNEYAARNGRFGVSPQVRIVGYDQSAEGQR